MDAEEVLPSVGSETLLEGPSIEAPARITGGWLRIDSTPGSGTSVGGACCSRAAGGGPVDVPMWPLDRALPPLLVQVQGPVGRLVSIGWDEPAQAVRLHDPSRRSASAAAARRRCSSRRRPGRRRSWGERPRRFVVPAAGLKLVSRPVQITPGRPDARIASTALAVRHECLTPLVHDGASLRRGAGERAPQ